MSDQREQRPLTTTDAGSPAPSDEYSLTVGSGGPNLLQDRYLNKRPTHFACTTSRATAPSATSR